jgi:hypothetical protein
MRLVRRIRFKCETGEPAYYSFVILQLSARFKQPNLGAQFPAIFAIFCENDLLPFCSGISRRIRARGRTFGCGFAALRNLWLRIPESGLSRPVPAPPLIAEALATFFGNRDGILELNEAAPGMRHRGLDGNDHVGL